MKNLLFFQRHRRRHDVEFDPARGQIATYTREIYTNSCTQVHIYAYNTPPLTRALLYAVCMRFFFS